MNKMNRIQIQQKTFTLHQNQKGRKYKQNIKKTFPLQENTT